MLPRVTNGVSGNGPADVFPRHTGDQAGLLFENVLPASNSAFGLNGIKHIFEGEFFAFSPLAIFYDATATTHPYGGPKGYYYGYGGIWAEIDTPNWFYYHDQAWKNPWNIPIRYTANTQSRFIDYPGADTSFIWVGNEAHGYRDYTNLFGRVRAADGTLSPLREVGDEATRGIDTYARVITHECTHKRCYDHIQGGAADADGDKVPDDWEAAVGLETDDTDSLEWVEAHRGEYEGKYTTEQGDDEVFARMHERGVFGPMEADWAAGSDPNGGDPDSGLNYGRPPHPPHRCQRLAKYPNGELTVEDLENNVEYAPQP